MFFFSKTLEGLFPVGAGNEPQIIPGRRWQGPYPVTHSFFRSPWQRHKLDPVSEKHIKPGQPSHMSGVLVSQALKPL